MSDPSLKNNLATPKSTPRRTLGIRRIIPKSAPYSVPLTNRNAKSTSSTNSSNQKDSQQTIPKNSDNYLTPVNKQRSKLSLAESSKIVKKLDLLESPDQSSKKLTVKPLRSKQQSELVKNKNDHDDDVMNIVEPLKDTENIPSSKSLDEQIIELECDIQNKRQLIKDLEKYDTEMRQLEESIVVWKAGGIQALTELKENIKPEQSVESILQHLRIPLDMFDISSIE